MKRSRNSRILLLALSIALLAVLVNMVPAEAKKEKKEAILKLRATAMDMNRGRAGYIDIVVYGWTSDEERAALLSTLQSDGNEALYNALHEVEDKGYVRTGGTRSYEMRYAKAIAMDGKRVLVMATDRPISMGEVMGGSRSQDYSITILYVQVEEGAEKGTGEMIWGAELGFDEQGRLVIEGASSQPTRFTEVRVLK